MEPKKTFELGVYTFGNTPRTADGGYDPTAQAIRDALEAVQGAEAVGLDFFDFGEYHTRSMPVSSPTSRVIAAAATTRTILERTQRDQVERIVAATYSVFLGRHANGGIS
jgi:hypothetical protein